MNIERNQITISLSSKNYWLSIVECESDDYHTKELALVHNSPSDFFGISIVPLSQWYGNSSWSEEHVTFDLLAVQIRPESHALQKCLSRAEEYLSRLRGFELDSENKENN
jgi:hypothetical protein